MRARSSWLGLGMMICIMGVAACARQPLSTPLVSATATAPAPRVEVTVLPSATPEPTLIPTESSLPSATPAQPSAASPTVEVTPEQNAPAATETEPPAASAPESTARGCEDKAAFYEDVSIPDDTPFKQSVEFEKIWRIRNEGTCPWTDYKLVWAGGSLFDAALENPIPNTAPGEMVDVAVKMHSPNNGGVYTSQWQFQNPAGKRFGVNSGGIDLIWVRISVTWYPEGSSAPGVSPMPTPVGGCDLSRNPGYIDELLALINAERLRGGLKALTLDAKLNAAAQAHSEDMACKNFMDHTGSDGSNWAERVKAAGYTYSYVSENIYAGDPDFGGDAQGAFEWWMDSKVHHDNMLSPKITQIGIGFAASDNAQFHGRYTLNFARP